jgi:rare lipoprotein A
MKTLIGVLALSSILSHGLACADGLNTNGKNHVTGIASWYSRADLGIRRTTANNETFCDRKNTCAIWGLPFNTLVRVTNMVNGKSVVVRVNDRGPAKRLVRKGRVIDLTRAAFLKIADPGDGLIPITLCALRSG